MNLISEPSSFVTSFIMFKRAFRRRATASRKYVSTRAQRTILIKIQSITSHIQVFRNNCMCREMCLLFRGSCCIPEIMFLLNGRKKTFENSLAARMKTSVVSKP